MKRAQIKKLDQLWSKKVKQLAGYACELCGKSHHETRLNSCHIIGRSNRTTRWLLSNGMCLCFKHHQDYDTHQPDGERIRDLVIERKRLEMLNLLGLSISKYQDYEQIKETLL